MQIRGSWSLIKKAKKPKSSWLCKCLRSFCGDLNHFAIMQSLPGTPLANPRESEDAAFPVSRGRGVASPTGSLVTDGVWTSNCSEQQR